jgi:hypothetical protein
MSIFPTSNSLEETGPGQLLHDLEQRQDDVLQQLDDLDAKLNEVLKGLSASMDNDDRDASDQGELPLAA